MEVLRKQNLEVEKFKIGDQIEVGKYTATCQKIDGDKAVFLMNQYLDKVYRMNDTDTSQGGYNQSRLRNDIKDADMDENLVSIRKYLIPFDNGGLLRFVTFREMFGGDYYYLESDDSPKAWIQSVYKFDKPIFGVSKLRELMKARRNRIADRNGGVTSYAASNSIRVRPVFQLAKEKSGDLVSQEKNKGTNSKKTLFDEGASDLKALMDTYIRAGFSDRQAFQLILTAVETACKK